MTRTYLYILGWLLMWLTAVPVQAQNVAGEDEKVGETLSADTLVRDSLSLKWPHSAVHGIDRLLEADMFQTSQVGLMVYDLTADSVIYRHNERQMMRPASTMKLLTAIAASAVRIRPRPSCAIPGISPTVPSRATSTAWVAWTPSSMPMICQPLSRASARWASTLSAATSMPTRA